MRSRYSAFALGAVEPRLDAYLLSSWHPSTRPESVDVDDGTTWRRLQIVDTVAGGPDDDTGIVEFRASFRDAEGAPGLMQERSTFTRLEGRWVYLEGEGVASPS
jgi:SEC-C motif-containing protein